MECIGWHFGIHLAHSHYTLAEWFEFIFVVIGCNCLYKCMEDIITATAKSRQIF